MKNLIIILTLSFIFTSCVGGDSYSDSNSANNGDINNANNINNMVNNINDGNNIDDGANNSNNLNNTSGINPGGDPLTSEEIKELLCEDATDIESNFYMSADDSASQAHPVYLRTLADISFSQRPTYPQRPREYEFLNYYTFEYEPAPTDQLRIVPELEFDPISGEYQLLIGVVSHELLPQERRGFNFTFSVDTSGSMSGVALDNVKHSLRAMASQLREGDIVSMVEWSTSQDYPLDGYVVSGPDDAHLMSIINNLTSGGGTNLSAGLLAAYELARQNFSTDRLNRVFLLSDGGANVGVVDMDLIAQSTQYEESEGIFMVGIGTATSYYSHDLMDTVTDMGKGAYVYIPNQGEAEKMFTGQRLLSNVEVAALNVRLQVTLPPLFVISEFHGEEISQVAEEVKQQHLAPNDAMMYHSNLLSCATDDEESQDAEFTFKVTWTNPSTMLPQEYEISVSLSELMNAENINLEKSTILVEYARLLSNADYLEEAAWSETRTALLAHMSAFHELTGDPEILEIVHVLQSYLD